MDRLYSLGFSTRVLDPGMVLDKRRIRLAFPERRSRLTERINLFLNDNCHLHTGLWIKS